MLVCLEIHSSVPRQAAARHGLASMLGLKPVRLNQQWGLFWPNLPGARSPRHRRVHRSPHDESWIGFGPGLLHHDG